MAISAITSAQAAIDASKAAIAKATGKTTTTKTSTKTTTADWALAKKVRAYTQTAYDVVKDSTAKARVMGTLTENVTALTASSTLSKKSTTDYYKFTVTATTKEAGIIVKAQGAPSRKTVSTTEYTSVDQKNDVGYVNVQVLDSRGKVIADSSTSASLTLQKAYQDLRNQTAKMEKGTYYLKISMANGVVSSKSSQYAVQMIAGDTATKTYTTKQLAATGADATARTAPGATALSIIDASTEDTNYGIKTVSTGSLFDYSA